MHCPNINSPQWKSLVNKIGENNAWREFLKYGDAVYDRQQPNESDLPQNVVDAGLKSVDILQSSKAEQVFAKGEKNKWSLDKILTELQVPKEQIDLIKEYNITDRAQIITNLLSDYSYTVEINISKDRIKDAFANVWVDEYPDKKIGDFVTIDNKEWKILGKRFEDDSWGKSGLDEREAFIVGNEGEPTQGYSSLTVQGGTNYTENEVATPAITPNIKGHAQFATDKGIGWFRSDDRVSQKGTGIYTKEQADKDLKEGKISQFQYDMASENFGKESPTETDTKTRRILEVQSDLFQKGRGLEQLTNESKEPFFVLNGYEYHANDYDGEFMYSKRENKKTTRDKEYQYIDIEEDEYLKAQSEFKKQNKKIFDTPSNQFLQLLNKGNNWVTFFVKSIIQDSAKKGYEKVVFPTGATAYKIESGGNTIEDFIKNKEDRIKKLEKELETLPKTENRKYVLYSIDEEDGSDVSEVFDTLKEAEEFQQRNSGWTFADEKIGLSGRGRKILEIEQLKREIEDAKKGASGLAATAKFYETSVNNVLNKQYGKENIKQITDEYGNTWNELTIAPARDTGRVLLSIKTKSTEQIAKGINKKLI